MPELKVPQDFLDQLSCTENCGTQRSTTSVASITGSNGKDTADIYLGFKLDGYQKYNDISTTLPSINFQFSPPPMINRSSDVIQFNPSKDDVIFIKVALPMSPFAWIV